MMSTTPSPHMNRVFQKGANVVNMTGSKRVYQVWKGSNKFFLGGRLVFGPDVRSLFLTLFLIVTPIVVFCVFVGRHLMKHFHDAGFAIIVVVVVHTVIVLVLLLLTSGRDPGIIPRNAHPPEPEEDAGSSSDWSGGQTPKLRLPRTKDVIVNGVVVKIKYCDTCMLYRPPRCSHCSICNNCVDRFDHHCPWVGQCIGRRNYPYFFGYVVASTMLCIFIFAMCALWIKTLMDGDPPLNVWKALQKSPASGFLMAFAFLATWFVGGLSAFHLYLMSTNQTTYENFRYRYDKKLNPYNQSVLRNIRNILCSSIPPSKVNFRAQAPPEVAGFGNLSSQQRARDDIDAMGLKSGKRHCDIEMNEKSWMGKPAKGMEDVNASECIEKGRHGFEDSFPEDFCKSFPREHQVNFRAQAPPEVAGVGNLSSQQRARDDVDAMGLKSGKRHCDIEMNEKSWMGKPAKGMEDVNALECIEEGRHGFEDSFPEDFCKSIPREHQNARSGSYSRRGRQSGNWDPSPELIGFTAGTGGPGL